MIKKILILLFFGYLISNGQVFSQSPQWSLRGGLNLSSIGGDDAANFSVKPGFHLGIMGTLPVTEIYSLESGLLFSTRGGRYNSPLGKESFTLNYIDLPILARVNIYPNLDVMAGPQLSYLINSAYRIDNVVIDRSTEGIRRMDLGVHLGAAYRIIDQVSLGLGYDWGLLTHDKEGIERTFNRLFKFTVGYHFN